MNPFNQIQIHTKDIQFYQNSNKIALIIEPRLNDLLYKTINNFAHFMNPLGWNFCVVSAAQNEKQLKSVYPNILFFPINSELIFERNGEYNISIDSYNKILMSIAFWGNLKRFAKHVCIFQTDCFMFKMFDEGTYLDNFDFAGANWYGKHALLSGENEKTGINGGFSLRNVEAMLDCLQHITWKQIELVRQNDCTNDLKFFQQLDTRNEDVFFTFACDLLHIPVLPCGMRSALAIECDCDENTCVIHGYNKCRHNPEIYRRMLLKNGFCC